MKKDEIAFLFTFYLPDASETTAHENFQNEKSFIYFIRFGEHVKKHFRIKYRCDVKSLYKPKKKKNK